MNTSKSGSKQRALTSFRMNTFEKEGRGGTVIVNQKLGLGSAAVYLSLEGLVYPEPN
jgi:hypothetical protein